MKTHKNFTNLLLANKELAFQNKEKEKRAAELLLANDELVFQNEEKEKRAIELIEANRELLFQNQEKVKRAEELDYANQELLRVEKYQKDYIDGLEKMLYMISHEVRQPLAHLVGLSGLLEKIQTSGTLKKLLDYVRQSINALDTYTRDLTKFATNLVKKGKKRTN
ncbi:MAG: histidine kinase dimerization/phospho-acceptor domain-containing protein [Bacteroidota bacterium]